MSDKTTSQAQQFKDTWTKMVEDHVTRFTAAWDEAAKLETKGVEHATNAIDELAKIQKETLGYFTQLTNEWRKVSLEATKRTADFLTPKS